MRQKSVDFCRITLLFAFLKVFLKGFVTKLSPFLSQSFRLPEGTGNDVGEVSS